MTNVGSVRQWPKLAAIFHVLMYTDYQTLLLNGRSATPVQKFAGGTVRGIDVDGKRYVAQNPRTDSVFAARARQGSKIMWVIDLKTNEYLGRVDALAGFPPEAGAVFMKHPSQLKAKTRSAA